MRFLGLAGGGSFAALAMVTWAAGCGGSSFQAGGSSPAPDASMVVDSGVAVEAGDAVADAPADVEAGTMWCAEPAQQGHTFCEDFDEYPNVSALINGNTWVVGDMLNGSFQFDTTQPVSPPNALVVNGDDGAQVVIIKSFTGQSTIHSLKLTFDLRVDSGGAVGLLSAAGFAAITFGTSIDDGYVAMAIAAGPSLAVFVGDSTGVTPADAGVKPSLASGAFPSAGVWEGYYTLEVDYGPGAPNGCAMLYKGVSPLLAQCLMLPASFASPKAVSIGIGDVAAGGMHTGSIGVEFDNLTFDIK